MCTMQYTCFPAGDKISQTFLQFGQYVEPELCPFVLLDPDPRSSLSPRRLTPRAK